MFIITVVVYFVGGVVMLIFSQATLQPWAAKKKEVEEEKMVVREAKTQETKQLEDVKKPINEATDDEHQPEIQVVSGKPVEEKPKEQRF